MKVVAKPVVKDAAQYAGWSGSDGWPITILGETFTPVLAGIDGVEWWLAIHTPEGKMYARPGDWIIKGANGEFYPCTPDIFEKTYTLVDAKEDE